MKHIYLAGGCFWGVQKFFDQFDGVEFTTEESQLPEIRSVYEREQKKAGVPLAVELLPLENFYTAEEYHQKYLDKNPGGYCHISPAMFTLGKQSDPS